MKAEWRHWFQTLFVEIVCFLSLSAKAILNLSPFEISCYDHCLRKSSMEEEGSVWANLLDIDGIPAVLIIKHYFEGDVGLLGYHMQVALEMPVIYLLSFGVSLF